MHTSHILCLTFFGKRLCFWQVDCSAWKNCVLLQPLLVGVFDASHIIYSRSRRLILILSIVSFFQKTQAMQVQLLHTSGTPKAWLKNWPGRRSLRDLIGALLLPPNRFLRFSHKSTHFSTLFANIIYR